MTKNLDYLVLKNHNGTYTLARFMEGSESWVAFWKPEKFTREQAIEGAKSWVENHWLGNYRRAKSADYRVQINDIARLPLEILI
jgi:hypothetical protein